MPQITCPHCRQPYDIPPEQWPQYQGQRINCTRCNQPYIYRVSGKHNSNSFDVLSIGPDGREGGGDDIGNW